MKAWRWPGDKLLSETMMVRLSIRICVTWPQWVKLCSLISKLGISVILLKHLPDLPNQILISQVLQQLCYGIVSLVNINVILIGSHYQLFTIWSFWKTSTIIEQSLVTPSQDMTVHNFTPRAEQHPLEYNYIYKQTLLYGYHFTASTWRRYC